MSATLAQMLAMLVYQMLTWPTFCTPISAYWFLVRSRPRLLFSACRLHVGTTKEVSEGVDTVVGYGMQWKGMWNTAMEFRRRIVQAAQPVAYPVVIH